GRGDRNRADQAAVDAMRLVLNSINMDAIIVSGEGEKDEAPMLYNGEILGTGDHPQVDVAVDPIDGTRLLSLGQPGSISVVAVSERGTMFDPRHIVYMDKLAVGPEAAGVVDINAPVPDTLRAVAKAKGRDVNDLMVMILDRPRHEQVIAQVRDAGARIRLIPDGDVSGALATAMPQTGVDLLLGIGGAPEALIAACALKCVGGEVQCKLWPRNDDEVQAAKRAGLQLNQVLRIEDLVKSDNVFFCATGITDGELLEGVRYYGDGARTHSVVMRSKSGTTRFIVSDHRLHKLMRYSAIDFE
ncbi:MAG: class II fructose-bisphosphatase, partial [Chloroflexi bacterium]|nr:class II fructose-bisphosphatase [Chloroflexota bacterium]